ncbi:MAG: alpha/beta hydrolase [Aquificae bacterium]|nr:alpha/beta hydrolase [Aquificota bacterium]
MKIGFQKAVLLLHAFPLNKDMYRFQMEAFQKENIPFVAVDYPGFGDNPPPDVDYTIETLADSIFWQVHQLGIKDLVLIGDSMGGYIMFQIWKKYKEYVKGLIFTATRAEADDNEARKARYALIKRIEQNGKEFLIDVMLDLQTSPTTKQDEYKMRTLRCIMEKATKKGIIKALKALAEREDNTEILKTIYVPTLVIAGKDDEKVTPPKVVEKIAKGIDGARFHVVPNSAHLPPFENPKEFNQIIIPFIKQTLKEE